MREFKVQFTPGAHLEVTVPVDETDEDVDLYEQAIDAAYEHIPEGVCPHCSGFGSHQRFFLDVSTVDIEAERVYDDRGELVYEAPQRMDARFYEIQALKRRIAVALDTARRIRERTKATPGLREDIQFVVVETLESMEKILLGEKP